MKNSRMLLTIFFLSLLSVVSYGIYQYVYIPSSQIAQTQECSPVNFNSQEINSSFYLKWNTKEECTGFVRYGSKKGDYSYLALDEKGVVKLKEHSVKLNGINKGDQYYFVIISNDKIYGLEDEAILLKF